MIPSNYRVRRATLEDLDQLTALWRTMHFDSDCLAKGITEFQVAETAEGRLLGAVGLQIAERQGRIHSEGFMDFALAEHLRPLLWERINSLAANHGLLRLWTQEQAPFWNRCGLVKADEDIGGKLPGAWRGSSSAWLTLKLREDLDALISLDKEFAMFRELQKQNTERTLQRARTLKTILSVVAFLLFGTVLAWAVYVFLKNPQLLQPRR